jgi:alpha-galactosidase
MVKILLWSISAFYLLHGRVVLALNNGLASKPPMGWKPWNAFQGNIYDALIRTQIDALTSKSRTVDGVPTSLADLGYLRMGIDDNWQACKTGWQGSFHAQDGTPLVNHSRFPNIKDLVTYGHSKGVLMGWYTINCMCMDTYIIQRNTEDRNWTERVYAKEAQLILEADFDGVKIDNCGDDQGIGFELIMKHLNASGKPILVEDCNQGNGHGPPRGLPSDPHGWCPGNFFRTGHDIVADFASPWIISKKRFLTKT